MFVVEENLKTIEDSGLGFYRLLAIIWLIIASPKPSSEDCCKLID